MNDTILEALRELKRIDESKEDQERFISKFGKENFNKFISNSIQARLKNNKLSTDMTWYTKNYTKLKLEDLLDKLTRRIPIEKDSEGEVKPSDNIRGEYKFLGEKDGYKVYQPLDALASMDLGYMTGWCTTGRYRHAGEKNFKPSFEEAKKHFHDYTNKGIKLFYFLDSKTMEGKYAIALYPTTLKKRIVWGEYKIKETNIEIFNQKDCHDYMTFEKLPTELIPYQLTLEYEKIPEFEIEDRKLINYNGKGEDITLPDNVTIIGDNAFWKCTSLRNIKIPDTVTSIEECAFYDCTKLTSIKIPHNVTNIEEMAFYGCISVTSITIGSAVTSIGQSAFANTPAVESITIDSGNTVYKSDGNCCIKKETNELVFGCKNSSIPDYVTSIGDRAFHNCTSLTDIYYTTGTKAQFTTITKGTDWKYNVPKTCLIHCSDGDLKITEV